MRATEEIESVVILKRLDLVVVARLYLKALRVLFRYEAPIDRRTQRTPQFSGVSRSPTVISATLYLLVYI